MEPGNGGGRSSATLSSCCSGHSPASSASGPPGASRAARARRRARADAGGALRLLSRLPWRPERWAPHARAATGRRSADGGCRRRESSGYGGDGEASSKKPDDEDGLVAVFLDEASQQAIAKHFGGKFAHAT